jgi:hypothetical protein
MAVHRFVYRLWGRSHVATVHLRSLTIGFDLLQLSLWSP